MKKGTVTKKRITKILTDARAIVKRGWCQYVSAEDAEGVEMYVGQKGFRERAEKFCATGAVRLVIGTAGINKITWQTHPAIVALAAAVPVQAGLEQERDMEFPGESIIDYNDEPGRTRGDVLKLFDRAIKKLRAA